MLIESRLIVELTNYRWAAISSDSKIVGTGDIPPVTQRQLRVRYDEDVFTFSRPQPTMQLQQNKCPHSVEQLSVRSSKHSVHLRASLTSAGIDATSRIVPSSSSAFFTENESSSSTGMSRLDTGLSSKNISFPSSGCIVLSFPFTDSDRLREFLSR